MRPTDVRCLAVLLSPVGGPPAYLVSHPSTLPGESRSARSIPRRSSGWSSTSFGLMYSQTILPSCVTSMTLPASDSVMSVLPLGSLCWTPARFVKNPGSVNDQTSSPVLRSISTTRDCSTPSLSLPGPRLSKSSRLSPSS